jgi:hypothetical protein
MAEFTSWDSFDWNAFARLLPNIPDEVVVQMVRAEPQGEAIFGAWENAWKTASGAIGVPTEKLLANNRAFRSVITAFYKAEAARRGLDS